MTKIESIPAVPQSYCRRLSGDYRHLGDMGWGIHNKEPGTSLG